MVVKKIQGRRINGFTPYYMYLIKGSGRVPAIYVAFQQEAILCNRHKVAHTARLFKKAIE